MGNTIDLSGQKFSRLMVIKKSHMRDKAGAKWQCECECGTVIHVNSLKLRSGKTKSCGCLKRERRPTLTHGMSNKTKTYRTWKEMRQRCTNPNSGKWKWYGGKGISVCPAWNDYEVFLSDMGERPEGKTLDRIDPAGNYEPNNCRWATAKQQAETNGGCFKKGLVPHNKIPDETILEMQTLKISGLKVKEIASIFGINYSTASSKLKGVASK